jgi:hypothetical protein
MYHATNFLLLVFLFIVVCHANILSYEYPAEISYNCWAVILYDYIIVIYNTFI